MVFKKRAQKRKESPHSSKTIIEEIQNEKNDDSEDTVVTIILLLKNYSIFKFFQFSFGNFYFFLKQIFCRVFPLFSIVFFECF